MNVLDGKKTISLYKNRARGVPNSLIYPKCIMVKWNGFAQWKQQLIKIKPAANYFVQFFFTGWTRYEWIENNQCIGNDERI